MRSHGKGDTNTQRFNTYHGIQNFYHMAEALQSRNTMLKLEIKSPNHMVVESISLSWRRHMLKTVHALLHFDVVWYQENAGTVPKSQHWKMQVSTSYDTGKNCIYNPGKNEIKPNHGAKIAGDIFQYNFVNAIWGRGLVNVICNICMRKKFAFITFPKSSYSDDRQK